MIIIRREDRDPVTYQIVDLDVGLLSEEERANAGAMAVLMWGGDIGLTVLVWKRWGSHPSGVEEVRAKRCGRGRRGTGVEEGRVIRAAWASEQSEHRCGKRSWRRRLVNPRD